ncbi:PQ-loop repeat-containing protein 1 [Coelomomyces lativittatus]|nr:PQ-loop repeat-containing protein 1 [Coelomomyces lativittatus]
MIPTQLLVLELCLRIERRIYKERLSDSLDEAEDFSPRVSSRETVLNRFHFLHCTLFLLLFITFFEILHLYLSPNKIYTEALGTLALGLEATLPMFQCYSNYKNKSTAGLSLILIFSWFVGDTSKIIYYLWIGSPLQFSLCGCIQLFVDLVIFGQMKWYKSYPSSVGFNPIPQRAHSF